MKFGKKIVAIALGLSLFVPSSVFASTKKETHIASIYLEDAMNVIMENYVGEVTVDQLYDAAMRGMTEELDVYSIYFTREDMDAFMSGMSGNMYGVGITLEEDGNGAVYIYSVLEDTPANRSGLMAGDQIIKINNNDVQGKSVDQVHRMIRDEVDNRFSITVLRDSKRIQMFLEKEEIQVPTVEVKKIQQLLPQVDQKVEEEVGYIRMTMVGAQTGDEFAKAVKKLVDQNKKILVLDMRSNGGGFLDQTIKICNEIVPSGPILHTVDSDNKKNTISSKLQKEPFQKVYVLVDHDTASAAEVITAALQDSGATVIGNQTFGKGVIQSIFSRPDGAALKLTTEEYFRRSGKKINRIGVIPDVVMDIPSYIYDEDNYWIGDIKEILAYLGYPVGSDSDVLDEETITSIKSFQENKNIKVTGQLDFQTLLKLNTALSESFKKDDVVLKKAIDMIQANK